MRTDQQKGGTSVADRDNKSFWQRVAGVYGGAVKRSSGRLYDAICARIRPHLAPEMSVLELACGTGQLTYPLTGSVALWEATDISEKMIEEASRWPHSHRLRFSVQDATNLPYEHDTFDAVVVANALHVMSRPEQVLREIRRVLRPGGLLFAPTYVHGGIDRPRLRFRLLKLAGFRVFHPWTGAEYMAFLQGGGFAIEDATLLPDNFAPVCYVMARNTK